MLIDCQARGSGRSPPWHGSTGVLFLFFVPVTLGASPRLEEMRRRVLADPAPELGTHLGAVAPVHAAPHARVALVYTALGENESAFALLEKAYDARDPLLIEIQSMDTPVGLRPPPERAATLRADPRFTDLVRRMGFPRRDAAGGPSTPASGAPEGRR
jgi:hypothetical protein